MDLKKLKERFNQATEFDGDNLFVVSASPEIILELIELAERQEEALISAHERRDLNERVNNQEQSSQAVAWRQVCAALDAVAPGWLKPHDSRTAAESAVDAIKQLAADRGLAEDVAEASLREIGDMASPAQGDAGQWIGVNIDAAHADQTAVDTEISILRMATKTILAAEKAGIVVRIETEPLLPLAMGNYKMVASAQPRRAPAVPYDQLNKPRESDGILHRALKQQLARGNTDSCEICSGTKTTFGKLCPCVSKEGGV